MANREQSSRDLKHFFRVVWGGQHQDTRKSRPDANISIRDTRKT